MPNHDDYILLLMFLSLNCYCPVNINLLTCLDVSLQGNPGANGLNGAKGATVSIQIRA